MTMLAPPPTPVRGMPRNPAFDSGWLDRPKPAPMFDPVHPLASTLPLAQCVEDPFYRALVVERGDPSRAALDARISAVDVGAGPVVEGVVVDGPPTMPLPLGVSS